MNKPSPQQIHAAKRFYKFFSEIPSDRWCQFTMVDRDSGRRCAISHLVEKYSIGGKLTQEGNILCHNLDNLFMHFFYETAAGINDKERYPKNNILKALDKIINYESMP